MIASAAIEHKISGHITQPPDLISSNTCVYLLELGLAEPRVIYQTDDGTESRDPGQQLGCRPLGAQGKQPCAMWSMGVPSRDDCCAYSPCQ
jgi:hypothetical protein